MASATVLLFKLHCYGNSDTETWPQGRSAFIRATALLIYAAYWWIEVVVTGELAVNLDHRSDGHARIGVVM